MPRAVHYLTLKKQTFSVYALYPFAIFICLPVAPFSLSRSSILPMRNPCVRRNTWLKKHNLNCRRFRSLQIHQRGYVQNPRDYVRGLDGGRGESGSRIRSLRGRCWSQFSPFDALHTQGGRSHREKWRGDDYSMLIINHFVFTKTIRGK